MSTGFFALVVLFLMLTVKAIPLPPPTHFANISSSSGSKRDTGTSTMRPSDVWDHNAFSSQCVMKATLAVDFLTDAVPLPAVIKTDPVAGNWYFNGGVFGTQWITPTAAYTTQFNADGSQSCWKIPGWNFTQQVKGYRSVYQAASAGGSTITFSGHSHDITSCTCETSNTIEMLLLGNGSYRLLRWSQRQRYPVPVGRGVKINIECDPFPSNTGPTVEDMTLPAICTGPELKLSYCADFGTTPSDCGFIAE